MRSPLRWMRRRRELTQGSPRRKELESELNDLWARPISLAPASAKGGYDEIYYATAGNERVAVVRVNSPFKTQNDPIGPRDPGVPLGPADRLDREWSAYQQLFPLGLSPKPLWRTDDAIACSWIDWPRVSSHLASNRQACWEIFDRLVPAIRRMHDVGVSHLDLNLGNALVDTTGTRIAIIDFEFGPVDWVRWDQQVAYDYLRVVDDFTKPRRGGSRFTGEPDRVVDTLDRIVPASVRDADIRFSLEKLHRLADQTELLTQLRSVFPRL